ncbi:MAG: NAD-dependent epimerase/dehydratase family protein [Eubacterium sp.]|nr:NAD-dependent epimerase/dehydratase family protein [Eubacterium sp.]
MKILVLGGTRFFGIPMVKRLVEDGHEVTIATRGRAVDPFGDKVERVTLERTDPENMKQVLAGKHFDVVIDKIAYASNDIKYAMESIDCDKYIQMSSTAVYDPKVVNTVEEDFDGKERPVIWCNRADFPYAEIKRQAEFALWQEYSDRKWIAVRYPVVLGRDDYTARLKFYVDHVKNKLPMRIDNLDYQMSYIRSDEAGLFLAYLVDKDFEGAINGCSDGTISLREIIDYLEEKTGNKAVLSDDGDDAPYNGDPEFSINTDKAKALGFKFTEIHDWIYELLDYYLS